MATTYTGLASNIGALTPVTVSLPADGDSLSAASVNAAFQKLTDYIAYLETQCSPMHVPFSGAVPTTGNATMYMVASAISSATTCPAAGNSRSSTTVFMAALSGVARSVVINTSGAPIGGNVTFTLRKNGVSTALAVTMTPAGGNIASATGSVPFVAGDWLELQIVTAAGFTSGLGSVLATLGLSVS